jgi:hypothetical protein
MAMWVFTDFPDVAEKAIPQFTACLSDKDDTIKGKAAMVLGKIGRSAPPAGQAISRFPASAANASANR